MARILAKKEKEGSRRFLNVTLFLLYILLNVIFYVVVVMVAKKLCTSAYDYGYQIFGNVSVTEAPGNDVQIQILEGESSMEIAKKLEANLLVTNRYTFYIRTKLTIGKENPILPGTYKLNTSMCYDEILSIITDPAKNEEQGEENDSR